MVFFFLLIFLACAKAQVPCVEQTNACPPLVYLDALSFTSALGESGASAACLLFFASASPYVQYKSYMEQNITIMQTAYAAMQNASFIEHNPIAYQGALYMMRQAISGAWLAYRIAKEALVTNATCTTDDCLEYVSFLMQALDARSTIVPIDTIVETSEGVLCIVLYSLVLVYAGLLLLIGKSTLLTSVGLKYYRLVWLGLVAAATFKLAWWCTLLVGMGVQTGIPPLAGRILFRTGVVLQFFTVLLFLFLWIRAYFALYFESHKLSIVCYVILSTIGLGGFAAVLAMGILAEQQGGYDFSVPFLYTLEWLSIATCIIFTTLALYRIVNPEHKEKVRGLYIILLVESILLVALTLGLVLSFYVLYRPPLYEGGGWLQFFAMVAVPDLIMFGAFLTLIGYNCFKVQESVNKRNTQLSTASTKSTSVLGSYGDAGEECNVPERYKV